MPRKVGIIIVCALAIIYLLVSQNSLRRELDLAYERLSWLEPVEPSVCYEPVTAPAQGFDLRKKQPAAFETLEISTGFRRPTYMPEWSSQGAPQPDWCYIPRLIEINRHRLFLFAGGGSYFADLVGLLGIRKLKADMSRADCWYLILLGGQARDIYWVDGSLLVEAAPSLTGLQVIAVPRTQDLPPACFLVDSRGNIWEEAFR